MAATVPHGLPLLVPANSMGTDQRLETEKRTVWDESTRTYQEHEFVYEVSWVPELGVWRRFLKTHRKP